MPYDYMFFKKIILNSFFNSIIFYYFDVKVTTIFYKKMLQCYGVEWKTAPLSNKLTGLILPNDHFGRHLNERGLTIDGDLEKKHFQFAGNILAEIWSQLTVDNFPTVAEFIDPIKSELQRSEMA
jgi:hypothetical protein